MTHRRHDTDSGKIVVQIDPGLEAIVPGFLANRQRDVATIEASLKQGDLHTIRLLGHRMKGDGGGYGFDRISTIGHHLEEAALMNDRPTVENQVAQLREFLANVTVVYTQ